MSKVILITANSFSGLLFLNCIIKAQVPIKEIIIVSSVRGNLWEKLQRSIRLLRKRSKSFLFYKFFIENVLFKLIAIDGKNLLSMKQISKQYGVSFVKVNDVNDNNFISKFENFKNSDEIVLSTYGSQIFGSQIVRQINNFWNIHGSYLPFFKGAAPYFWMLIIDEYPRGVTLHHIVEDLDAGKTIKQIIVDPADSDSLLFYHAKCVLAATRMFISVYYGKYTNKCGNWKDNNDYCNSGVNSQKYGLPSTKDVKNFRKEGKSFFCWSDFHRIVQQYLKEVNDIS